MGSRDWRVASDYDYVDELDLSGLAWEFLRRNPDYQREYAVLSADGACLPGPGGGLSPRWGLRFCL